MKDTDLMPFGKHKDVAMANVPASYLLWLHKEGCNNPEVMKYIKDNMDQLRQEQANGR